MTPQEVRFPDGRECLKTERSLAVQRQPFRLNGASNFLLVSARKRAQGSSPHYGDGREKSNVLAAFHHAPEYSVENPMKDQSCLRKANRQMQHRVLTASPRVPSCLLLDCGLLSEEAGLREMVTDDGTRHHMAPALVLKGSAATDTGNLKKEGSAATLGFFHNCPLALITHCGVWAALRRQIPASVPSPPEI
ncbi:unnamed protein product [Pleuronectes platessa]|uniref:Uncharacterized protein n=1 Tax=Pleuronectes platessa TaxID=8262 RepID=A0A9N7VF96_PLEPL|nr:unnamed protein product [Pleuronectes platessa]